MQVPRGALAGAKPEPGCSAHALRRASELPRGLFRLPRQRHAPCGHQRNVGLLRRVRQPRRAGAGRQQRIPDVNSSMLKHW